MAMKTHKISDLQTTPREVAGLDWYRPLTEIVGSENVLTAFTDLLAYGRDRWPYGNLRYRFGEIPGTLPTVAVMPGSYEEVSEVLKLMSAHRQPVIPYGAGSGVLGGAVPQACEVTMDLKRLNKVVEVDEISGLATVQGGMNGELFEAYLNKSRLTLGHFPQSLNISTVGGWLACRSAGQASSYYGKIEDMVRGIKVILADGRMVEVHPAPRRATGPSVMDFFVGSEGTLGVIVEGTFRVLPYPEKETLVSVGFEDYLTGLEALRLIMQTGLHPAITRLYDEHESAKRIADYPEYAKKPCLCMLSFMGMKELVDLEERMAIEICEKLGGQVGSIEPMLKWIQHRYESLSAKPVSEGRMMDTIEMAASWRNLPEIYEGAREAVMKLNPEAHFGCHWSHVYSDGGCMYMTFIIPAADKEKAASDHRAIWNAVQQLCLKEGGTISHHHGVGLFRSKWLMKELGLGHDLLQAFKNVIDPNHIMNPTKLGLR